jgi:hypothetical protein
MSVQQQDIPPEVVKAVPGALGSLVALRWIVGTPLQRMTAVLGGSSAAYYGTPYMGNVLGTDHGLTGFLLGLFAMAIAAKIFDMLAALSLSERVDRLLTRWGL